MLSLMMGCGLTIMAFYLGKPEGWFQCACAMFVWGTIGVNFWAAFLELSI